MLAYSIIEKKQQGQVLRREELTYFIGGYVKGEIPDYQMSALLMAIYFRGMDETEVSMLIELIIESGERLRMRDEGIYYADKHSTGGVGDKISLILAPLLAATGRIRVPMISGRGLGHSGGTLDKLESIPGFRTDLDLAAFQRQTREIGCALIGQTATICPADKKLYALRDVTATVRSIPLICGSILSKKTAEGIQGLVLDVKSGRGAFMQEREQSRELAENLVKFGNAFGLETRALITDMSQPLGRAVGNWLEVAESLDVLNGEGPVDVRELSLELSAEILMMADKSDDRKKALDELAGILDSGRALEKFIEIAEAQGGDSSYLEGSKIMGEAKHCLEIKAEKSGYIKYIDNYQLGLDGISLGAGRRQQSDGIDALAGMLVEVRIGQEVREGDLLVTLFSERKAALEAVAETMSGNFVIGGEKVGVPELVAERF